MKSLILFIFLSINSYAFELLPNVVSALEVPTSENIKQAKIDIQKIYGNYPSIKNEPAQLNSTYFQVELEKEPILIKGHSLMVKKIGHIYESLKDCSNNYEVENFIDPILNTHLLGLTLKIKNSNNCLNSTLVKNGFYQIEDDKFIYLSDQKHDGINCPFDMVKSNNNCIDRFEAPNILNVRPHLAPTAKEAMIYCKMQNKILCSDTAWENACKNEDQSLPYPYGTRYKNKVCNDDKKWKNVKWGLVNKFDPQRPDANSQALDHVLWLNQATGSGSYPECKTQSGIYDLTGNVAEWVLNTKRRASTNNGHVYQAAMKGCYWSKCFQGIKPSCSFTNANHSRFFRSYEAGFRCCIE